MFADGETAQSRRTIEGETTDYLVIKIDHALMATECNWRRTGRQAARGAALVAITVMTHCRCGRSPFVR